MNNAVIYSFVSNDYDQIKKPLVDQHLPMVCYTDNPSNEQSWQYKTIEDIGEDAVRTARYYKLHPHKLFPKYTWSVWVDGSLSITNELGGLVEEVFQSGHLLGVYKHAKRDCLYQAAMNCIDKAKDDPEVINQQMRKYHDEGYPEHNGLVASGVLVRKHHEETVKHWMNNWWKQINAHSRRDQLSFNYVTWKMGQSYYEIPERIGDARFFRRNAHRAVS